MRCPKTPALLHDQRSRKGMALIPEQANQEEKGW
jgi:hypothetical protein